MAPRLSVPSFWSLSARAAIAKAKPCSSASLLPRNAEVLENSVLITERKHKSGLPRYDKARTNATKHKVTFEEGATVWTDPFALIAPDPEHSTEEIREWIIGMSHRQRYLLLSIPKRREHPHHQRKDCNPNEALRRKLLSFPCISKVHHSTRGRHSRGSGQETIWHWAAETGRPTKDESERYEPVSIRLHSKVIEWAKEEAAER